MSAVRVHGVLLLVGVLVAFQTWTRDGGTRSDERAGTVILWEEDVDDIFSVTFESPSRTFLLERRVGATDAGGTGETYLWGIALPKTSPTDSVATVVAANREEFPVGDAGDELLRRLASLRALRDLGELDDDAKEEYELTEPERAMTIDISGVQKKLELGGTVFGGPHRYALDPATGRGYVISNDILRGLEGGPATLQSRELHRYDDTEVTAVNVRTATGERQMMREMDGPFAVWSSPDTPGDGDQTFANFMERVQQLSVLTYDVGLDVDTLQLVVRIDFTGESEAPIGFLEMFRAPADDQGVSEFYLRSEATRVAARASRSFAERVAQDLADIF